MSTNYISKEELFQAMWGIDLALVLLEVVSTNRYKKQLNCIESTISMMRGKAFSFESNSYLVHNENILTITYNDITDNIELIIVCKEEEAEKIAIELEGCPVGFIAKSYLLEKEIVGSR